MNWMAKNYVIFAMRKGLICVNNLYFINSRGVPRLLGANVSEGDAWELIKKFLEAYPHFKHYYTRTWTTNHNGYKGTWFDVGSHTEFFFLGSD